MPELAIAFLGDVVGNVGRRAVAQAVPILRQRYGVGLVIVNGENARHGSGITPDHVRELRTAGVDAITLGDHCFKDRLILPVLEDPAMPVSRPANLAPQAPGKRIIHIEKPGLPPVYVMTVLGRLFMPMPSDNPFQTVDRELAAIQDPSAMAIVEIHGEATSEKQAMAWYCLQKWTGTAGVRVIGVVGTHTHVQTADARILEQSVAAITDLGMSGPHRSVIGRSVEGTLRAMVEQAPTPLDVASDDVRACGVVIRVDTLTRRAVGIEAVDISVKG